MVCQLAAAKTIPGDARAGPLAAAVLPSRGAKLLAAAPHPNTLVFGEAFRCSGEVLTLPRSRCITCTFQWSGMRGGLVGMIPEALWGGPARSSDDPRLSKKITQTQAKREAKEKKGGKWPTIVVTVDKGGQERTWGRLSRTAAWKAGCYWKETKGDARIFLEKA